MERVGLIAVSAVLAAGLAAAQGSDRRARQEEQEPEYFDRTPQDCISITRVRDTEIIDESTILFYLRGGSVYRNVLDKTCRGLDSRRVLSLTARGGRLCRADSFQHFTLSGGVAFASTFCIFGKFHPVTREEAALMELDPNELAVVRGTSDLTPIDPDDGEPITDDGEPITDDGEPITDDGGPITNSAQTAPVPPAAERASEDRQ